MKNAFLALALLLCTSCTRFNFHPHANQTFVSRTPASQVRVLYESPNEPHQVIGVYDISYYQAGFRGPSVHDSLPTLKEEVSLKGGDAFVIRTSSPTDGRVINIAGDVIRYQQQAR